MIKRIGQTNHDPERKTTTTGSQRPRLEFIATSSLGLPMSHHWSASAAVFAAGLSYCHYTAPDYSAITGPSSSPPPSHRRAWIPTSRSSSLLRELAPVAWQWPHLLLQVAMPLRWSPSLLQPGTSTSRSFTTSQFSPSSSARAAVRVLNLAFTCGYMRRRPDGLPSQHCAWFSQ